MTDMISRKALQTSIRREPEIIVSGLRYIRADAVFEKVRIAPTIEAEPVVHGRWVKHPPSPSAMATFHAAGIGRSMGVNSIYWTCSECGTWGTLVNNYCPNCGAKMDAKDTNAPTKDGGE